MYEYHEQFNKAKGDLDAQTRWARQLTWEIARHAVGEEIVVYPLMEKHLGQHGLDLANQDRKEHLVRIQIRTHLFSNYSHAIICNRPSRLCSPSSSHTSLGRHLTIRLFLKLCSTCMSTTTARKLTTFLSLKPRSAQKGAKLLLLRSRVLRNLPRRGKPLGIFPEPCSNTRNLSFSAHPGAPDRPPYETLSAFIATPIDKLKDMFAKFPTEEMKQAAK